MSFAFFRQSSLSNSTSMCHKKRRFLVSDMQMNKNKKSLKTADSDTSSSKSSSMTASTSSSSLVDKSLSMIAKTFFPALSCSDSKKPPSATAISDDDDDTTDDPACFEQDEDNDEDVEYDPDLLKVMHAKYATPQDQDVAVFVKLTQQLSLKSTLHLLQGHARAMNINNMMEKNEQLLLQGITLPAAAAAKTTAALTTATPIKKRVKKFRFAEVANQKVRVVVHSYSLFDNDDQDDRNADESKSDDSTGAPPAAAPAIKGSPDASSDTTTTSATTLVASSNSLSNDQEKELIWWSMDDLRNFRTEAIETVHYFKRYRPDYVQLVETVAACSTASSEAIVPSSASATPSPTAAAAIASIPSSQLPTAASQAASSPSSSPLSSNQLSALEQLQEQLLQNAMKRLVQDSFARGLEIHICTQLGRRRRETVQAVLEEQQECWASNDSYDTTSHCLREQSLAYSQWSSRFAVKMAECDTIDALQASLSRWGGGDSKERMEV